MFLELKEQKRLLEEKWSLIDFLPYDDEEQGVFIQVDGSLGCIWKLSCIEAETLSPEDLEGIVNDLSVLLSRLDEQMMCQVILRARSQNTEKKEVYQRAMAPSTTDSTESLSDLVTQAKIKYLLTRSFDIFLTIRYFVLPPQASRFSYSQRKEEYIQNPEFVSATQRIENHLSEMKIKWERVREKQLIQFLYEILNPNRSQTIPCAVDPSLPIREQVLYHAPQVLGFGLGLEKVFSQVLTLQQMPHQTFAGMMSVSSQTSVSLLDLSEHFLLVFNIMKPNQVEEIEKIKLQKSFAFIQRQSSLGDISEEAEMKKNELGEVVGQLFSGHKALMSARMHLVVFGDSLMGLQNTTHRAMSLLHRLGFGVLKEDVIGGSLFLSCLPCNFDNRFESFIRRSRRIFSDNLADILPLYGACQGTPTPASLYMNRKKEAVYLDLFDTATNPHAIILGSSGAGKSFFTNDFILQNYRMGGQFFVLDKGHSYRKICSLLQGEYLVFDLNHPITINPFFMKPTAEQLAFLMDVIALMASGADERDRLTREEKGLLQIVIMGVYEKFPHREIFLRDVVSFLQDSDEMQVKGLDQNMGLRLALRLAPWTHQGPYGGFFDGPNQMKLNQRFVVFELNALSGHPDLQAVVLLNVMFFITQYVSQDSHRQERKYLLIDEAWQLLKTMNTAEFISHAFKTFRKYHCAVVAITQEVFDLLRQECGMALLANSANKIFLKQEMSMIDRLQQELNLSNPIKETLKTLKIVKGQYSEALILTSTSSGVLQLHPDGFLYWASTSDARENDILDEKSQHNQQFLLKSIMECAKEFPHGIYD